MKKILALIAFATIYTSNAQDGVDCQKFITTSTDEVTGKSTTAIKDFLEISSDNGKSGIKIILMLTEDKKTIITSYQTLGSGKCIDEKDVLSILFTDGKIVIIANDKPFNCKGRFSAYYGKGFGDMNALEMLCTKDIKTLRLNTQNGAVQENFSAAQATTFKNSMKCLSDMLIK